MSEDLTNRFKTEWCADDPPVHLFRCDRIGPREEGIWTPERIWHRLRWLGAAYEVHLLPLPDGSTDPLFLNGAQCRQLEDELRFVGEHIADPIVEDFVRALIALLSEESHGTSNDMVGIEFP